MFNRVMNRYCVRSVNNRLFSTSTQPSETYQQKVSKSFKDAWKEEQENNGKGLIFPALFTIGFIVFYSSAKDKERRLTKRVEDAESEVKAAKETLNDTKKTIRQKEAQLEQYKNNVKKEFEARSASIAKNLRVKENVLKQEISQVLDSVDKIPIESALLQDNSNNTPAATKQ